jgi:ubiquinone/menaquinone biosynthesis C-methylase UbiE
MVDKTVETIIKQYDVMNEDKRLEGGFGLLEKERTKELISRYLSKEELSIIDVGGATGVYSLWLASLGHQVHLIDIVPKHIELAKQKAISIKNANLFKASVGDARSLEINDNSVDIVISHGPLYHLVNIEDRLKTLSEAKRVLKPGGILLAFTITRYAGINYAIPNGLVFDEVYYSVMKEEVETGVCNNNPQKIKTFTNAFFHLPKDIENEITESGLLYERTIGVIGTSWLVPDLNNSWNDIEKRNRILAIARLLEDEPVLGPRMLTIARKK